MDIDLKDLLKRLFNPLNPKQVANDFKAISDKIEVFISRTQTEIAQYGSNIIEDTSAKDYFNKNKSSIEEYEVILNAMLSHILDTDDYENGTFCKKTCPNWEHIQTAYILHILNNLEITASTWTVKGSVRSIKEILEGLIKGQREEDGSWGEDFYDVCITLSALLLYQGNYGYLKGLKDAISKALKLILSEIDDDFKNQKNKEWYGAGFMGAALYLFSRHFHDISNGGYGLNQENIKGVVKKLLKLSHSYDKNVGREFEFYSSDYTSEPTTPDIWHTAEMIIGLKYYNDTPELNGGANVPYANKLNWIKHQAYKNGGLWCSDMGSRFSFIVTGRVLHALALADESYYKNAMVKLADILKRHYNLNRKSGLIYDLPVTINLLLGISAKKSVKIKKELNETLSGILLREVQETLKEAAGIKQTVDTYKSKYIKLNNYFIIFSISFFLFSIGFLLSSIVKWLIK